MKILTTLTGPTCAGKSTLEEMMAKRGCLKAVSTTTRSPRAGEKHGVHYYFVSPQKFEATEFVENAQFGDHRYGLSAAELERLFALGDHVVLVCEPIGAKLIDQYCQGRSDIELRQVFVDNPDSVINERFLQRMLTDAEKAKMEIDNSQWQVIQTYAKRMTAMSEVESEWRAEAHLIAHPTKIQGWSHPFTKPFQYDLVIERFDESNCDMIVDALLTGASTPA